nr:alpha/beta hydrolase [Corynebacterium lactis]
MTTPEQISLARDGATLNVLRWDPAGKAGAARQPRAVVQLVHGMVEHSRRYAEFAEYLIAQGFAVVIHDHRGHGETVTDEGLPGFFAASRGWEVALDDVHAVREFVDQEFAGVPHFLLGHSMGSLMVRDYLSRHGAGLAGAVVVGTAIWPEGKGDAGLRLAELLTRLRPKAKGRLLNAATFAGFNNGLEGRTDFDWLSRDHQVVDAYIADPNCGFVPTNTFFRDLMVGTRRANSPEAYRAIPSDLPILVISGAEDPVGGAGAVAEVVGKLRGAGVEDLRFEAYPGARHEILNEINRDEVFADIVN